MKSTSAEIAANAALVLLGVACALLDRQIEAQAAAFTDEGGASRSGCTAFAVKGENMALNESIVDIVFEEDPDTGALHKIIAGYHQFHAVNAALEEKVRPAG